MTDAALLLRCRGGDELAFRRLVDRHDDLIEPTVRRYFGPGLDRDDLRQEALVGLHNAVRDYKAHRHSAFRGFARLCIERQVITAVKTATRRKHAPLSEAWPLDVPVSKRMAEGDTYTLAELVPDIKADVVDLLDVRSKLARLKRAVWALSELERDVVLAIATGASYEEISVDLDVSLKSVDNAIQRARAKLGAVLAGRAEPGSNARYGEVMLRMVGEEAL